ncbi:DUF1819 family protein [Sulfitobacter sp. F26169L]|uniref:DUF1819 family protein n=1 Tax=Sulfitobacter sp. F26169L TaxID=2996015 RepID=UPI00226089F1|nr:DUF1819 family protein [Sulfitobacter sp. F26169L]MCX7567142.1 DUF1819 family protein [Sulfitobacter sp. F26169L]
MSSRNDKKYRMSFSTGGLFVNESVEVARHFQTGEAWAVARERLLAESIANLPKLASQTRSLREIYDRVSHLSDEERTYLLEDADRQQQQAVLWLAVCRTYRFIQEFAVEVVQDRYQSWRLDLGHETFDRFLAEKSEWNEHLAQLSPSTCAKLRQVLFRVMREAGVLNDDNKIQAMWLSPRLTALVRDADPSELRVFPGVTKDGSQE